MSDLRISDKFKALVNYIINYDYKNHETLVFPKEDGTYLEKACSNQVPVPVKINKDSDILYCPVCERHARRNYDKFCSGCGQKLSYPADERGNNDDAD